MKQGTYLNLEKAIYIKPTANINIKQEKLLRNFDQNQEIRMSTLSTPVHHITWSLSLEQ